MYTIGIISDSTVLTENFKKSNTQSLLNYVELGSLSGSEIKTNIEKNKDEIFSLIVILPGIDGKIPQNIDFINFIQREQYHIELLILVDLAGTVRNVESFVINSKQIPIQYYNSNEQIYNSQIKNYTVVRGSYEEHYELIRKCGTLSVAEFAEHITKNKSLIFGKLPEIKRQDHLDIDEFLVSVFRFSRYLNVAKTLGNPSWVHSEKLYGYANKLDAVAIGNAVSEITQTMDDHSLSSSKIDVNVATGTSADPILIGQFGDKTFTEILVSLKGDDWRNFVVIQAFDLLLDVPTLLRNTELPNIYEGLTNLIVSLKFDSQSGFLRTKIPQDDSVFLEQLWNWVNVHLDSTDYVEIYKSKNSVRLLGQILKELEISFTSINGFRHLVNLLAEEKRPEYYISMDMKTHTSSWVKQHAKIASRMTVQNNEPLSKYLNLRYLQDFLKKYPEIWTIASSVAETKISNSTIDEESLILSGFTKYTESKV